MRLCTHGRHQMQMFLTILCARFTVRVAMCHKCAIHIKYEALSFSSFQYQLFLNLSKNNVLGSTKSGQKGETNSFLGITTQLVQYCLRAWECCIRNRDCLTPILTLTGFGKPPKIFKCLCQTGYGCCKLLGNFCRSIKSPPVLIFCVCGYNFCLSGISKVQYIMLNDLF